LAGRQAQRRRLRTEIEAWTRVRSPDEAAAALQKAGIPSAPSRTTADVLNDAHLLSRSVFVGEGDERPVAMRMPWVLHPAGSVSYSPAPLPGEATEFVLGFR
jgi:crotonobetainyl-CoA:carnitine CoA-transferase CaiB-like acyl-CoA transferase